MIIPRDLRFNSTPKLTKEERTNVLALDHFMRQVSQATHLSNYYQSSTRTTIPLPKEVKELSEQAEKVYRTLREEQKNIMLKAGAYKTFNVEAFEKALISIGRISKFTNEIGFAPTVRLIVKEQNKNKAIQKLQNVIQPFIDDNFNITFYCDKQSKTNVIFNIRLNMYYGE